MSKKSFIYEARKNGVSVITGTAPELAKYFGVTLSIIGNCERCGRKIHGSYEIERRTLHEHVETESEL